MLDYLCYNIRILIIYTENIQKRCDYMNKLTQILNTSIAKFMVIGLI